MVFSRILHRIFSGWEFWLPLPFIGLGLWFGGQGTIAHILSRPSDSNHTLQTSGSSHPTAAIRILMINAEIDRDRHHTTIHVKTNEPASPPRTFEVPVVNTWEVEAAIAQQLQIPTTTVRQLVSYRITP